MPINPPYGLIEALARLRMQGPQSLSQGILSAGQSIGEGLAGQRPDVVSGGAGGPAGGFTAKDYVPAASLVSDKLMSQESAKAYPGGMVPVSLAQHLYTIEAGKHKNEIQVDDTVKALAKKAGFDLPADQKTVTHDQYHGWVQQTLQNTKPPSAKEGKQRVQALRAKLTALSNEEKGLQTYIHPVASQQRKGAIQLERQAIEAELQKFGTGGGSAEAPAGNDDLDALVMQFKGAKK